MLHVTVAIVGGGPAGSSAAEAAAREGANAVVFEKGVPREDRDELGPDSTDAAGFLDYWLDVADLDFRAIPNDVILQRLHGATFVAPTERVTFRNTGLSDSFPGFGFTFHRARFDDWLRKRAEDAGATYHAGMAVRSVETTFDGRCLHRLTLEDGSTFEADALILADGPQRQQTIPTISQFLPEHRTLKEDLNPREVNHIAYQEHRRFPRELFEPSTISFWWGWMPGETAYPWVFPNDDGIARVGLTMPIGMELKDVQERDRYRLLQADDEHIPTGNEYVRRLLQEVYPDYHPDDFPLVTDRGKVDGTEAYPISSTRPIDSPTKANVAVVGGAMGATSAFHEGGDHVAIRSGKIAGRLAALNRLQEYNGAWKVAIGPEVLRNVAIANVVDGFGPADWDRTFRTINRLFSAQMSVNPGRSQYVDWARAAGISGLSLGASYLWHKRRFRDGRYVQIREDEYTY